MSAPTYLLAAVEDAVTVNNQSSCPMKMRIKNMVYVLHDNRIYAFGSDATTATQETASKSSSAEQNIILNLLTTPFFRALGFVYILFRIFDNTGLVIIMVLGLIHGKWSEPSGSDYALFGTIGTELFYDVMLNVNKYWSLQRLSLNIGLVLYVIYFSIVEFKYTAGEMTQKQYELVTWVLLFRFCSFILEEMVDVAIDCCLHNALKDVSVTHLNLDQSTRATALLGQQRWRDVMNALKLHDCTIPPGIEYHGSFFAWGTFSVYDLHDGDTVNLDRLDTSIIDWNIIYALLAVPVLCTAPLALAVGLLIVVAAGLAVFVAFVLVGISWFLSCGGSTKNLYNYIKELVRV